jgi:hypothetical protein
MNTFEYLAVLFSIVVGLALGELLQSIRGLIMARRRVTLFWPAVLRAALLLIVIVQVWWTVFGLNDLQEWTFGRYAVVLVHVAMLYLATALALPNPSDGEPVDLRAAYYADARPVYGLLLAATATSLLKDLVIDGHLPGAANLAFHAVFAVCTVIAMASRRDRVHLATTALLLAGFLAYVVMLFDRLPD